VAFGDVALAPDGKTFAVSDDARHRTWVWRTETPPARGLKFSPPAAVLGGRGKDVTAAAWDADRPDRPAVVWRSSPLPHRGKERPNPYFERSFDLTGLQVGAVRAEKFSAWKGQQGKVKVTAVPGGRLQIEGVERLVRCPGDQRLHCWTLVNERWLAVGTNVELHLYDTATGNLARTYWGHTGGVRAVAPSPDGRHFLSVAGNQIIRIWDPQKPGILPLLSLFALDNEWIAWTPQGYYAASMGGERRMGWQFADGREGEPSFYPAGQFRLCAALGSEKAGEADGHGYFCRSMLEALNGENQAPRHPRDRCVYLHHPEQYVIDRVGELSKDTQHPTSARPAMRPLAVARP
jgi:hypothetical protein